MNIGEKPRIKKWKGAYIQCEGSGISRIGYDLKDAYERWLITFNNERVTTGHCENKKRPSGCQLRNLQCGYPDCDRAAV